MRTAEQMRAMLIRRLKKGLSALEEDGLELVIVAMEKTQKGVPTRHCAIAGTVPSVLEVHGLLVQAASELEGEIKQRGN